MKFLLRSRIGSIFTCSLILSVFIAAVSVHAATTISTNVNTGGTLTVSGAAYASSTANITGLSTLTGGFTSWASSSVNSAFTVGGILSATSTVLLTSGFTSYGNVAYANTSTTTVTFANSGTSGPGINFDSNTFVIDSIGNRVGVATSGPVSAFSVMGTSTLTDGMTVGVNGAKSPINEILFGSCSVDFGTVSTSTGAVANCAATGVTVSHKVFVTPYFQEPDNYVVFTSASSTANGIIQVAAILATTTAAHASATSINPAAYVWSWMAIK